MPVPPPSPTGIQAVAIPVIDLSGQRSCVSELIVKACEEYGFFKVVNHSVPDSVVARMEAVGLDFFSLPGSEKQSSGLPSPLGYGFRSIGCNGDIGEVEYLLLHTNSTSISLTAKAIGTNNPSQFSCVVNEYVKAVRELACDILELLGEGLDLVDSGVFSRLIRDNQSDSLLRLNHYPPYSNSREDNKSKDKDSRIGFGDHSDPQILTLLRSNGVDGLQILFPSTSSDGGAWVPVPADPTAFCVHVGDILQAMTNGRLVSVRHRVMANSYSSRLSIVYFGAPPPYAMISPLPEMITLQAPCRYKSFTWGEYKKAMYSLRLGHNRLDHFRREEEGANK